MNPLGLSDEEMRKIEPSLLKRLSEITKRDESEIEVFVEIDGDYEISELQDSGDRPPQRSVIENMLGEKIPEEIEIVRWYGFMNTLALKLPVGSFKGLFDVMRIEKISDVLGDIKPTSGDS